MKRNLLNKDLLLAELQKHIGAQNGISCNGLSVAVAGLYANAATERQLRKTIEDLRRQGHHICGTPKTGYFIAQNEAELLATCGFLHDRAMTTLTQVAAMRRVALPDIAGQLRLRT